MFAPIAVNSNGTAASEIKTEAQVRKTHDYNNYTTFFVKLSTSAQHMMNST